MVEACHDSGLPAQAVESVTCLRGGGVAVAARLQSVKHDRAPEAISATWVISRTKPSPPNELRLQAEAGVLTTPSMPARGRRGVWRHTAEPVHSLRRQSPTTAQRWPRQRYGGQRSFNESPLRPLRRTGQRVRQWWPADPALLDGLAALLVRHGYPPLSGYAVAELTASQVQALAASGDLPGGLSSSSSSTSMSLRILTSSRGRRMPTLRSPARRAVERETGLGTVRGGSSNGATASR